MLKKVLGSGCSRTAISAFLGPILIHFNHWFILFFCGYNLKGIRVSLEISLPSSFYLLRFCFIIHLPFIILTLRRVMHLVMSYYPDKFNYFKDFLFFYCWIFYRIDQHNLILLEISDVGQLFSPLDQCSDYIATGKLLFWHPPSQLLCCSCLHVSTATRLTVCLQM